jgi:hypothetical protein
MTLDEYAPVIQTTVTVGCVGKDHFSFDSLAYTFDAKSLDPLLTGL